jgi:hypothetical protein
MAVGAEEQRTQRKTFNQLAQPTLECGDLAPLCVAEACLGMPAFTWGQAPTNESGARPPHSKDLRSGL